MTDPASEAPKGPPKRTGPRNEGDAWVYRENGERYWGKFGSAGLVAWSETRGILLQHRVDWSHFGNTWGIPGGARLRGESAYAAALREAHEEAAVPADAINVRFTWLYDLGDWSYTTIVGDVTREFKAVINDPESNELAWVAPEQIDSLELHPRFAEAWPEIRAAHAITPLVIVDIANLMGSHADGWWRNRAAKAKTLIAQINDWRDEGIDAELLGLPGHKWWPEVIVVTEGQAKRVQIDTRAGVTNVAAPGEGDDEIVAQAEAAYLAGKAVTVVTSDKGLRERLERVGSGGTSGSIKLLSVGALKDLRRRA